MSDTNNKVIERYLNEMLDRIGTGNLELLEVREQITNLKAEYEKEREAAKNAPPDKKKAFERHQEALAKGLPGITKGTLDSIRAFQRTPPDVITGSAAVMDICASLASTLGGLSAAGGPPGALIGALFSTISMILSFFAPKPPSLLSQIEEMLRTLQFETKQSEIIAAQEAVFVYVNGCDKFMKRDHNGHVQDPDLLTRELERFNLIEGNTVTTIRTVRQWLLQDGNWDLDGWPEILNLLCQVYMYLLMAVTRQDLYANDQTIITEYLGEPIIPSRELAWSRLQREMKVKLTNIGLNNGQQLSFLKQILPVARKRGTFVVTLTSPRPVRVSAFAASGPKALREGNLGRVIFEKCRRVAVVPAREGVDHPDPKYDFWVLPLDRYAYSHRNQLAIRTRTLTWDPSVQVGPNATGYQWLDCWPLPNADGTFTIYTTRNLVEGGEVATHTWSPSDPSKISPPSRYQWYGRKMRYIRVAKPSVDVLPGDPDAPTTQPYMVNGENIIYATFDGAPAEIWGHQINSGSGPIPIPMARYTSIAVDEYCVWVFGEDGLVGATHASIGAFLQKRRAAPNWFGPPSDNRKSIIDMSVCGDGTLTVCAGSDMLSGLYRIDFAKDNPQDRLTVTWEKWINLYNAHQLQKLQILGWPLLDASIQTLTAPATDLARPSYLLN